jgi:hypothetical protein
MLPLVKKSCFIDMKIPQKYRYKIDPVDNRLKESDRCSQAKQLIERVQLEETGTRSEKRSNRYYYNNCRLQIFVFK